MAGKATAAKIARLLELTSLNNKDDEKTAVSLCERATGSFGHVASVCVWPHLVHICKESLKEHDIKIATVINFPAGNYNLEKITEETEYAVTNKADEINLVFPYKNFMAGDRKAGIKTIKTCREICGNKRKLKVILETGMIEKALHIINASNDCINAGADFIMTSTGKTPVSSTCEAANAMLETLSSSQEKTGFAASGEIHTFREARDYIDLASLIMGKKWINRDTFRLSANNLLNELLSVINS